MVAEPLSPLSSCHLENIEARGARNESTGVGLEHRCWSGA
uniref:Uncharacterized protein n=1 Tax=Arundo donax TaxID=35708 RepID=A0A0A8YID2_ARUDO